MTLNPTQQSWNNKEWWYFKQGYTSIIMDVTEIKQRLNIIDSIG